MISELLKAYNDSGRNKAKFFELAYKRTGARKSAFKRGQLKDLIDTLIFK